MHLVMCTLISSSQDSQNNGIAVGQFPGEMPPGSFARSGDWGVAGSRDCGQLGNTDLQSDPLVFPSCV